MAKSARVKSRVTEGHLKGIGLLKSTHKRYWYSIFKFFEWRKRHRFSQPKSLEGLDYLVGEYINCLFQLKCPQYLGHDLVSGLTRFYPRCKGRLPTAKVFLHNWTSVIERRKALPLSPAVARGFAGLALAQGQTKKGLFVLICFLGLLRVSEACNLRVKDLVFLSSGQLILLLHGTKMSQTQGSPESCRINDLIICSAVKRHVQQLSPTDLVFPYSREQVQVFTTQLGKFFGLVSPRLTTHTYRRGGASCFFEESRSYDLTQQQGRWAQLKVARSYIDAALADRQEDALPDWGLSRLQRCNRILPGLLEAI